MKHTTVFTSNLQPLTVVDVDQLRRALGLNRRPRGRPRGSKGRPKTLSETERMVMNRALSLFPQIIKRVEKLKVRHEPADFARIAALVQHRPSADEIRAYWSHRREPMDVVAEIFRHHLNMRSFRAAQRLIRFGAD